MKTILSLFEESVTKHAERPFLWEKKENGFESTSYQQIHQAALSLAAGLVDAGILPGDRIALLSEGRNDWVIAELGILYAGAVNVPLSIKLEPAEVLFRLNHAACRFVMVSDNQSKKIETIQAQLETIEKFILLDSANFASNTLYFRPLIESGKNLLAGQPDYLQSRRENIGENTLVNICYTSGTTADPKGIMLSHLNYYCNVMQAESVVSIPPHYRMLNILPLDHSFAHTAGIYTFIKMGASMAFVKTGSTGAETLKNIPLNIKEIKPDVLLSVPALAKNFRKNIEKGIRDKGAITEKLFNFALHTTILYNGYGFNKGKGWRAILKPLVSLFDSILFKKVREGFGGNLKFFVGGGALLDLDLQKFFYAVGMPMYQGYGLSEASPIISANGTMRHKLGSSGVLVRDLELKICDNDGNSLPQGEKGEIVVKGDNVMLGYWKNEKASAEALKDGWLFTGDMGSMDSDGFLYVMGRFKSLLIGQDGEKYSPEGIEEALVEYSPFIDQILLYNNQSPITTALIFPNKEAIKRELKKHGIKPDSSHAASKAIDWIVKDIRDFKTGGKMAGHFPERWLPSNFGIITEGFTEANHQMNSTMKIVRNKITDVYADYLSYLISPEAKNPQHERNAQAIRKLIE